MNRCFKFGVAIIALLAPAFAHAQSTINTAIPQAGNAIQSAPIRGNFAAAASDIDNIIGQYPGQNAPATPAVGMFWRNTSVSPQQISIYDGTEWLPAFTLDVVDHIFGTVPQPPTASVLGGVFASGPNTNEFVTALSLSGALSYAQPSFANLSGVATASQLPLGTSVANPGTGDLESLMPIQTETGSTYNFGAADLQKMTRRSNSGSAMIDDFPASTVSGMAGGAIIEVHNYDASASDTIAAGSGTTINGGSSAIIGPGRQVRFVYDATATNWRPDVNSLTALLSSNNLSDLASASAARANLDLTPGIGLAIAGNNLNLQVPTSSILGGVLESSAPSNEFATGINGSGDVTYAQPSFSNLSGDAVASQLPLGVSVNNPGSGDLEMLLPPQAPTVTSNAYAMTASDLFKEDRFSNSGVAFTVTLPPSTTTGLVNGSRVVTNNTDATATMTVAAGSGTQVNGASSVSISAARSVMWIYDTSPSTPTWRSTFNGINALLASNNLSDISNATTAIDNLFGTVSANKIFAGPASGSAANPTMRSLVGADLPTPTTSALGGIEAISAVSHEWVNSISTGGVPQLSQPGIGDLSGLGSNVATILGNAANASAGIVAPTPTRAGDIIYWTGSVWQTLAGNNSGTSFLQESSAGSPSWAGSTTSIVLPQSVSGTVNSGGVPYFSSTSQMSSSAAGAAGDFMEWGGPGTAPADSGLSPTSTGWTTQPAATADTALATTAFVATCNNAPGERCLLATLTASNSAYLSDTTHITSTYRHYALIFNNIVNATTEENLELLVYNGSTFETSGYLTQIGVNQAGFGGIDSVTTYIPVAAGNSTESQPGNSAPGYSGECDIANPSNASGYANVTCYGSGNAENGNDNMWWGSGYWNTTGAISGFKVLTESGNLTSGTIDIYGWN